MRYIFLFITIFCLGCVTSSKVGYLPKSSSEINFDQISAVNDNKSKLWTNETLSEFYIEIPVTDESSLFEGINQSFLKNGYKKGRLDVANQTFSAERGIRANEWATFTRVFYKINSTNTQLYVQSEIAQDGTGGWRDNRAKKVAIGVAEYFSKN